MRKPQGAVKHLFRVLNENVLVPLHRCLPEFSQLHVLALPIKDLAEHRAEEEHDNIKKNCAKEKSAR